MKEILPIIEELVIDSGGEIFPELVVKAYRRIEELLK